MSKKRKKPARDKDIYLVVADDTQGFQTALRYVSEAAKKNDARLAILHVMDERDFQPWAAIDKQIKGEQRDETESLLLDAARVAYDITGFISGIYVEGGGRFEKILEVIDKDSCIKKLVLGAEPQSNNPGPLVSYFTGKGLSRLNVPLTIIPGLLRDGV